jgi:hypothetical protein
LNRGVRANSGRCDRADFEDFGTIDTGAQASMHTPVGGLRTMQATDRSVAARRRRDPASGREGFMRMLSLCVAALALSACATPGDSGSVGSAGPSAAPAAVASYLLEERGCAVVAGGGIGSAFADPKVTVFWHKVNGAITSRLHEQLASDHYRVVKLLVPSEEAQNSQQLVVRSLAGNRCSRVIQVSHTVSEDAAGKFFRFDVVALRMRPKDEQRPGSGGTHVTTVGEFKREYRYARTKETFQSFQTGQFAATVLQDLKQSGALEPLR